MTARSLTCILLVVLAALGMARADPPSGNAEAPDPPPGIAEAPQRLPPEIVMAWKEAGAEVSWVRAEKFSFLDVEDYFLFFPEKEGKPGDLPALRFVEWQPGCLAKLPVPATPFGLILRGPDVTDAGMKELSRLRSLHTLDLRFTEVTDAGLTGPDKTAWHSIRIYFSGSWPLPQGSAVLRWMGWWFPEIASCDGHGFGW